MLIRICDHFRDNPKRIDKLIAIKGLPDEWFFRDTDIGRELKKPWEADIDKNIPLDIRDKCEPMYIVKRYPAIHNQAKEVIEKSQILGVRIDYNSEPGRQMWDDIERYVEESMPRNERIPVPVLCARDERSAFETYTPRRSARGSLELVPSPVPMVDLNKYVPTSSVPVVQEILKTISSEPVVPASPPDVKAQELPFKCDSCEYTNSTKAGVRMHKNKKHPLKQKAGV